jgi:excisionase family DNA binding protein
VSVRERQAAAVQGLPKFLRYSTVAQLLDVSVRTVGKWVADGKLHPVRLGGEGMPRIEQGELDRFRSEWIKEKT